MSLAEMAKIALKLIDGPATTTGTDFHWEPFQFATPFGPATHTSVSEIASIANADGAPLIAIHLVPFQCWITGLFWLATHTSEADNAETEYKGYEPLPGFGLVMFDHVDPNHCSMREWYPVVPTVHASPGDTAVTPCSLPFGCATEDQAVPSKCSISDWPTAQMSPGPEPDTAVRTPVAEPAGTVVSVVPSQCSMSGWSGLLPGFCCWKPTNQTS